MRKHKQTVLHSALDTPPQSNNQYSSLSGPSWSPVRKSSRDEVDQTVCVVAFMSSAAVLVLLN